MGIASNIAHYLIGIQADKDTVAPKYRKVRAAGDPSLMPNRQTARLAKTDSSRDRGAAYVSLLAVEGDLPIHLHPDIVSDVFYGVLGARASAAGTDTITPADDLPWFTIHRMFGNLLHESFIGCKILGLAGEESAGGAIIATLRIAGIKARWVSPEPASTDAEDDDPYFHHDLDGKLLFNAGVRRSSALSFSIDNAGGGYQADRLQFEDVDVGQREIMASWTERWTSLAEYARTYYDVDGAPETSDELLATVERAALQLRWEKAGATPFLQIAAPQAMKASYPINPSTSGDPVEVDVAMEVEKPIGSPIVTVTCTTPPVIP